MNRTITFLPLVGAVVALAAGALLLPSSPVSAETTVVSVGDIYYCDASYQGSTCDTTITVGDTVVWDFSPAQIPHTTTGDLWDSGIIDDGSSFSYTFTEAGAYSYRCTLHPTLQMGRILVQELPPTEVPAATPEPGATPAFPDPTSPAGGVSGVPATGQGPNTPGSNAGSWLAVALSLVGVIGIAAGVLARWLVTDSARGRAGERPS